MIREKTDVDWLSCLLRYLAGRCQSGPIVWSPYRDNMAIQWGEVMWCSYLWQFTVPCIAEKLDDIVKTAGVRHARLNDWIQLVQVVFEDWTAHDSLTSMHQVHIAFQRVDLSIVSYEPTARHGTAWHIDHTRCHQLSITHSLTQTCALTSRQSSAQLSSHSNWFLSVDWVTSCLLLRCIVYNSALGTVHNLLTNGPHHLS